MLETEVLEVETFRAPPGDSTASLEVDPVTTEVIRQGLNSAAEQMKRALIRTAYSPLIYEVLDFAVGLYDRRCRLLGQAPSLPLFTGTLNFCVEAAVEGVGGEEILDPGDIIIYNYPYKTGTHQQDMVLVMPVYMDDELLLGYAAIKAHWMDIGAKDVYCSDSVDVFQEGLIFPGLKLYRRGERVADLERLILANSRVPRAVSGDMNAQVVGVRTGGRALVELVRRHGVETFEAAVERMFDHGEAVMRSYLERIPDGKYVGRGQMDDNGLDDTPIPFEVVVEVEGSTVRVDYSRAPDAQAGPGNSPIPGTISVTRVAMTMLAGGGEAPNEGHFRPLEVIARPGSVFHPLPPSACYVYYWPSIQAIDAIYDALAQAMPNDVPASSAGDVAAMIWWGEREATGEPWADGAPYPVGQGAHARGDGANAVYHCSNSGTRISPAEVWETKNPWLLERVELAPDTGGPGKRRGGLGVDFFFHMLEDCWLTSVVERTKNPPKGLEGGGSGRANAIAIRTADGERTFFNKGTRIDMRKGTTLELYCGGGGGWGDPAERDLADIQHDLDEGYFSEQHVKDHYPQWKSRTDAGSEA